MRTPNLSRGVIRTALTKNVKANINPAELRYRGGRMRRGFDFTLPDVVVPPKPVPYKCDSATNSCTSTGVLDSMNMRDDWEDGKIGKGDPLVCTDAGCNTGFL